MNNSPIFEYKGKLYPNYIRKGNACRFILPVAKQFCIGKGLDVGCGDWPLQGAQGIDVKQGGDAMALPEGTYDYIFSSHCLEHLENPIAALKHWKTRLWHGWNHDYGAGVLFLYLPHPDMEYWLPQNCEKHLHSWQPKEMAKILSDLGFINVIHSERDMAWGFTVIGFAGDV